jgi:hypothetical protein
MRKTLGIAAATALAIGALAAPAAAAQPGHGEMAFGAGIKYHCGVSYGQLVSAARQSDHISGGVSGAKGFATGPYFLAHCPIES